MDGGRLSRMLMRSAGDRHKTDRGGRATTRRGDFESAPLGFSVSAALGLRISGNISVLIRAPASWRQSFYLEWFYMEWIRVCCVWRVENLTTVTTWQRF